MKHTQDCVVRVQWVLGFHLRLFSPGHAQGLWFCAVEPGAKHLLEGFLVWGSDGAGAKKHLAGSRVWS